MSNMEAETKSISYLYSSGPEQTLRNHLDNELVIGAEMLAFKHIPTWMWAFLAGGRGLCPCAPELSLTLLFCLFDFFIFLFTLWPCLFTKIN